MNVRRRQFLSGATAAGAGVLAGAAGTETAHRLTGSGVDPGVWASTIAPDQVRGAAQLWWSADPVTGRQVALTFDDGPTEQFTAHVLDLLAAARVPATFFVIGALVDRHPDLVRRAHEAGHELGNHSYDHISAAVATRAAVRDAVLRGTESVQKLTGVRPGWFRPPRGEVTSATMLAVREAGQRVALWSVNRGPAPDADVAGVRKHLLAELRPGDVVDLHDGFGHTAWEGTPSEQLIGRRRAEIAALPQVLAGWQQAGFTFTTLSDMVPK